MGTVHAKASEAHTGDYASIPTGFLPNPPPEESKVISQALPQRPDVDLKTVPAKVELVHIDGLDRTKNDLFENEVKTLFEANTFEEMVRKAHDVKVVMDRLGIFKRVGISIDTSNGSGSKYGYSITFDVEEMRRVTGGVTTLVGTNEGSVLFGIKLPNLFGRAERAQLEYSYGTTKSGGCNLSFMKPMNGNPDYVLNSSIFQHRGEYPWSGYKQTDRGISTDFTFPSSLGAHIIRLEGIWRDLACLSNTTSFSVREQCGHSIKSSIKHVFVRDKRDNPILPNHGTLLKVTHELAGLGLGNAKFTKHELELQANKSLFLDTVIQLSLAGGHMKSLQQNSSIQINDKLFLGGPLTFRGFNMKGIGPASDGNSLGGDTYWQCGLHVYTPLPFRSGKGGIGDYFRTHFFLNAGSLVDYQTGSSFKDNVNLLISTTRACYGAGVVLRMGGIARLELNYCQPLRVQQGDSVNEGLQFGIGVHFL